VDPDATQDATLTTRDESATADGVGEAVDPRGETIGRYLVVSRLGAGAMGVVLAAYDPELDRKVALKLLRPRSGSQAKARSRLQREAQALARLAHPNVVAVHDVGVHDDRVFVAMEHVEGRTLGEWLAEPNRTWPEIRDVFVAAGAGLAAAHRAGLVHRDFKPENVMIGSDERVRVMDFGIARAGTGDDDPDLSTVDEDEPREAVTRDHRLTATGALLGTPAYMSPEQFLGEEADARSDQFSFCVSLFEALFGERPFRGRTIAALAAAVDRGEIVDPSAAARVPAWLRRAVIRGLARDPGQRWEHMDALLAALLADPAQARRRWTLMAGGTTLVAAAIAWGATRGIATPSLCVGLDALADEIWNDDVRARVRGALQGASQYGAETAAVVIPRVDAWTAGWIEARRDACEDTRVRGEQSDDAMDLRMQCLERKRSSLRALVGVLAAADETVVRNAVSAVDDLGGMARCADLDALREREPLPEDPARRDRVLALDARLDDAAATMVVGRPQDGMPIALEVLEAAKASNDHAPLVVRAKALHGELTWQAGEFELGMTIMTEAYEQAVEHHMWTEAARAASDMVRVYGEKLVQRERAKEWAIHARALAKAAGRDDVVGQVEEAMGLVARIEGRLDDAKAHHERAYELKTSVYGDSAATLAMTLNSLGTVAYLQGRIDDAHAFHERALKMYEATLGPNHPGVAMTLTDRGRIYESQRELDAAREHHERALEIWRNAVGEGHPDAATALANLGNVDLHEQKYESAKKLYQRALSTYRETGGADHPDGATVVSNLGVIAEFEGKLDEAMERYETALRIRRRELGEQHPETGASWSNVGNVAQSLGDLPRARDAQERSVSIMEAALGTEHPNVAIATFNLASVVLAAASPQEAEPYFTRALELMEATIGAEHPLVAYALGGLADVEVDLGRFASALDHAERGLALRAKHPGQPGDLADVRMVLARALWDAPPDGGRDRDRARTLADSALEEYVAGGDALRPRLDEARAWRRSHR
jgi:tetratricopeptide (TPR) repeat protein/predicted Ser/Thr protein kinase